MNWLMFFAGAGTMIALEVAIVVLVLRHIDRNPHEKPKGWGFYE